MSTMKLCARAAHLRPSSRARNVRHLIDQTIRATGDSIVSNLPSRLAFFRLGNCLRGQSNLLSANRNCHPAGLNQIKNVIQVCRNLARYHNRWNRQPESWNANQNAKHRTSTDLPDAVSKPNSAGHLLRSLIDHLLTSDSQPPVFMYKCWFGSSETGNRKHQRLFLHVAAGNSIRGTDYGNTLTKKMVAKLNNVAADTTFENAKREVRTNRPAKSRIEFPGVITKRRRKAWVINPRPNRSKMIFWNPINVRDFYHQENVAHKLVSKRTWMIRQLTSRAELNFEGNRLQHCVGIYWRCCLEAKTSIWTMESRDLVRTRPLVTIEVLPNSREIWQIKGFKNRKPRKYELSVIKKWAKQESLSLDRWESRGW